MKILKTLFIIVILFLSSLTAYGEFDETQKYENKKDVLYDDIVDTTSEAQEEKWIKTKNYNEKYDINLWLSKEGDNSYLENYKRLIPLPIFPPPINRL